MVFVFDDAVLVLNPTKGFLRCGGFVGEDHPKVILLRAFVVVLEAQPNRGKAILRGLRRSKDKVRPDLWLICRPIRYIRLVHGHVKKCMSRKERRKMDKSPHTVGETVLVEIVFCGPKGIKMHCRADTK